MKIIRTLLLCSSMSLLACATFSEDAKTATAPTALTIQTASPPPELQAEERPESPGPGHIWVAGYWDYVNGRYAWRAGRWVAGMPGYEYVRAQTQLEDGVWVLHVPHWKKRAVKMPTNVAKLQ